MPTKSDDEDGNHSCHEHQIVPSTLLFDKVHIQREGCWPSCEILASIATIACGNNGWMSRLSLVKATWVRQALPLLRLRCPLVWLLRRKFPLPLGGNVSPPTSLEQRHKGFVQVDAEWLLASRHSSSTAVVPLPDCMDLVSVIWGSESETVCGLGI